MKNWGRLPAVTALTLALCVLGSGCTLASVYGQRGKKVTRTEKRTVDVYVVSDPGDSEVVLGERSIATPAEVPLEYEVTRVHYERRWGWVIGGAVASVGAGTTGAILLGEDNLALGMTVLGVCLFDAMMGGILGGVLGITNHNRLARENASAAPIPSDGEVRLVWTDGMTTTETVQLPSQRTVRVAKPMHGSYDAALIAWAETGERSPTPEGLLGLGNAYARRAKLTRNRDDVLTAIGYFETYLARDGIAEQRRREIDAAIEALRALEIE